MNTPNQEAERGGATTLEEQIQKWSKIIDGFREGAFIKIPTLILEDAIENILQLTMARDRERLIQRLEKEMRETGANTLCAYCGEHQASGDCSCGGINMGLDKAISIIKEEDGTHS